MINKRQKAIRWAVLVLAALLLAFGLEALQLKLLPPIFTDADVVIVGTPEIMQTADTYRHASGRTALVEQWNGLRLAATFLLQLLILTVLFPLGFGKRMLNGLWKSLKRCRDALGEDVMRSLKGLALLAGTTAAGFFLVRFLVLGIYQRAESNWILDLFSLLCGLSAGMLVTFRKTLAAKPEVFFLVFLLLIGGLLSFLLPDSSVVAWDDGYHYQHALNYSTMGHVRFTQQDMTAMDAENVKCYALGETRTAFLKEQNEANDAGAVYVTVGFHMQPKEYWMGFHGLGLFLGRLFRLSYWATWSLGRFTGLLAYALIGYFAIRRLRSGKLILASVLMAPEAVFLASNYSYDPAVTCFLALGCAWLIAAWQEPEKKLTGMDQAIMIGALFLGCIPKAIYFPMALLPLMLPKNRFENAKAWRRFVWAVLFSVLLLLLSFVLPFVFSEGTGDTRGGDDVNAFGQAAFILENPLKYTGILLRFLREYLNVNQMEGAVSFFAYMGGAPNGILYLLIMAVLCFTDRHEADENLKPWARGLVLFFLFGTVVLLTTAMYVSYNPVGQEGIGGVQPRYLLPVMYPAMAVLGSSRIRNAMKPALYNGLALSAMAYVGFASVLCTCLLRYA